jgi:putative drug exporter of the RND superfamily
MGRWFWWPQKVQTPASRRRMQTILGDREADVPT